MDEAYRTPEGRARVKIDALLFAAGWIVQDYRKIDLTAGAGVAVREFPTATGPADYLLYLNRKAIGSIEAKKAGDTLLGVESQADRYARGFSQTAKEKGLPAWEDPIPFHYISTGEETLFTSRRDPTVRPREVFAFHRPETLLEWIKEEHPLRARLRQLPPLDPTGLREIQVEAIEGLERSFASDRRRTLVAMTMGAGKTHVAKAEAYRLLRYGKAERILFLVDRKNLGEQAEREFLAYVSPDDGRKFSELFNIELLASNQIDPSSHVVISTVQRLYAALRGEELAEGADDESTFEVPAAIADDPLPVSYQPKIPIETFDFIFTDECHRSIYGRWGQVLDYFDAFLVGLTATPSARTYGYFDGNVVAEYSHEQSVIDGINVDYTVYRIKTEISEKGSTIEQGEWAKVRDRFTRTEAYTTLEDEITYDQAKLDRAVVAKDQIRTVIRTFRDRLLTEIFPGRKEVPKTVIFCKSDSHAEDVLQIVREEFGEGSAFARKITHKSQGSSLQHIQDFRTDAKFRIAVSVDQIATGTDIKPIECLVFMRMIQSRALFEQMKGRGVRRIDPDDLQAVTPDTRVKDHFVIVDCVGITDDDKAWATTKPLDREPRVELRALLQSIATGSTKPDLLSTIGARLTRLHYKLDDDQQAEAVEATGGASLVEIAAALIAATDADAQADAARAQLAEKGETREPTEKEIEVAREEMVEHAVAPLLKADVRRIIEDLQTRSEQLIDLTSRDQLVSAGFHDDGAASQMVKRFHEFIEEHHDEYVALTAYYAAPYSRRISLEDIKALKTALETPGVDLTPERIWAAYRYLEADKVKGEGGKLLTDIVSLIRFELGRDSALVPHAEVVRERFDGWLAARQAAGQEFSPEQLRWLAMIRDHIAASLTIEVDDFDLDPFLQEGGLFAAGQVFGRELNQLLAELNEELVAA